ncbi:NAD-dependent epimerase/dehydratase family protein [Arenivirga flava]|uniref:Reductase n=1 Tax=Arenivirga flava TaxID=1930060 RepID=A0AA37X9D1_9MICO|nr:NAD-dependent epimerase/dehydratase family protein [Arenivirga flava]GMA28499.1 reductase [Arenivirga flava]
MRSVLILGGSGWLGRRVAERALTDGAEVTCLARGRTGSVPPGARHLAVDRRKPDAYAAAAGEWDEVVELAHAPDLVEPALRALAPRAAHWTLVSSVSVYASSREPGADESAALVEPTDPSDYADAKVLAERMSAAALGDRLLAVRPGLIVGPGDPSDRFGYWPARLRRGGAVLAPRTEGRSVQVIDVDDLADWIVRAGPDGAAGPVNAVGRSHPLDAFLRVVAEATGFDGALVHAPDEELLARDVRYWAGPRSLPLWLPSSETGFTTRSGDAFRRSGGAPRPLEETVVRVLDDEVRRGIGRERRSGLRPSDEIDVIRSLA